MKPVHFSNSLSWIRSHASTFLASAGMLIAAITTGHAAPFTAGNVVVYRIGNGTSEILANTGNSVWLDEYSPSGTLVQSISVPASGTNAVIASGTATSEGMLSRSGDGRFLVVTGYNTAAPFASNVSASTSAAVNRAAAIVNQSGVVASTSKFSDWASGNNPRSAVTNDGTQLWLSGAAGGIRYTATTAATTATQINTPAGLVNFRQVAIFNGQIYATTNSTGSTNTTSIGTIGSGLPITSAAYTTLSGIAPAGTITGTSRYAFFLADLSAGVAGVDTLYIADDGALALSKYSLVGANWVLNNTIGVAGDAYRGVTGVVSSGTVTLFATRKGGSSNLGGGELVKIVDASGYNASVTATPTVLASAIVGIATAPNTAFRGVAMAPTVPASLSGTATAAAAFTTTYGTASAAQTFPITGSGLTANVAVTASANFEVSADGTSFGPTATFTQSGGAVSATLSVRLSATAPVTGSFDNVLAAQLTSTGAAAVTITTAASGNSVTAKGLTITADNVTKNLSATLTGNAGSTAFTSNGLANNETIGSVTITYGSGALAADPAGSYPGAVVASNATGGTFPASNYLITYVAGDITVNPAISLTISGLTADNKPYDRNTTATLSGTPSLVGVLPGDAGNVTVNGTPVATFATPTTANGKAVTITGYTLSGSAAGGYVLTQPTGLTADITQLALTVGSAAVTPKAFDGNTDATITGTLVGVIAPDVVAFNGTGTFASSAVGNGIVVTSTSTIGGADAGNYTLTQPSGLTGNITAPVFSSVNLANYVRVGRYNLPEPTRTTPPNGFNLLAQEASGVAYNYDTDTLFIVGDGGRAVVQVSKTGALIDSMTLAAGGSPQGTEFYDTEGITYIGGGQFVMTEERDRQLVRFTYVAGTTLNRASTKTVKLGTFVDNIGLEGLSYDPQTSGFICFKEVSPQGIFQTGVNWDALPNPTATNGSASTVNSTDLFNPGLLNLLDIADGFALSNLPALNSQPDSTHILVLSQESGKIVNTDRSGTVYSSLTIHTDAGNPLNVASQQHEGMTMDNSGNLYVVSENGGGDIDHPQLWVYAPSTQPNAAPTAIALANTVPNIVENTSTIAPVRVADIVITDDGLGVNNLTVSGADAASFQITGDSLYIKSGVVLDFETKTTYNVTVNVDDATLGGTPDALVNFTLNVTDVVNETPQAPAVFISEVDAAGSSTLAYGADWFELTNNGGSALDITGWQMDDNSNGTAKVPLRTVTSIPAGRSAIFIEGAADGSTDATILANFCTAWFGQSTPPAGILIGFYGGSGVGLSSSGDAVNVFDAAGIRMAGVSFGTSATGFTFDNHAGISSTALPLPTISTLSVVGVNAAYSSTVSPAEVGSPGITGKVIISEVAPWSSSNSPVAADWFELTNLTAATLNITGWQMDDNSNGTAKVAMSGITSIAPGESVIFVETAALSTTAATFRSNWFGANPPSALQIGAYSGGGVGLSTSSDAVNVFDAAGVVQARVDFGANSTSPFRTFDNAAGMNNVTISSLSTAGVNGAFVAVNSALETGSPGTIVNPPVLVTITAADANAAETASDTGAFRISRTGSATAALTVSYSIATGSGQASAADYTPTLTGSVIIPIGQAFVDITVTPVDDTIVESNETVSLTITDTAAYDLGAVFAASVTIADNDAALASFTVAAGDVTANSAVILAKVGVLGTVTLDVYSDAGMTALVTSASGTITDAGMPQKWALGSLSANSVYYYRVTDAASTVQTGHFKTAPSSATLGGLHFGISGDERGELAPYPSVKNVAAKSLDFFLQFGDTIYADVSSPNVPVSQARLLSEYRSKFNEVYSVRYGMNTLADLRASTAVFAVIDDHEVMNDFSGGALRTTDARFSADTGTYINETQTFLNGTQAFNEYHPIASLTYGATGDPVTANKLKLYRYGLQGKTAAMFVLDTRSFRSAPLPAVTNPTDTVQVTNFLVGAFTPGRTLLGAAQKTQFKADLLSAQAAGVKWKFVCCPEPIQNFGPLGGEDRYEGYAAERTELLKFIADNQITDVVFVSADFHGTVVNKLSYQMGPGQPQIQTNSIEIITGAVAYDKPFGPTIVDLAMAAGLAAPGTDLFYQSLNAVGKEGLVMNNIINPTLASLGYNQIGLATNPLPNMTLLNGLYTATNSYGWTEFTIDPTTLALNVKTWGIAPYSKIQLDADPSGITARTPVVVSEFVMTLTPPVGNWRQFYFGTTANSGLTADTADFDGDGIQNLMEYALGINPTIGTGANGLSALPAPLANDPSSPLLSDRLSLSFTIDSPPPADVTYTVQATDDLVNWTDVATSSGNGTWTWVAGGSPHIVLTPSGGRTLVKIGDNVAADASHPRRMMNLKVSAP